MLVFDTKQKRVSRMNWNSIKANEGASVELPLRLIETEVPAIPLFLDSPHSGNRYPADFRPLVPLHELRRVEDAFVDELFAEAPKHGAGLLAAEFPRSYIDPNRAISDIDPDMIDGVWTGPVRPTEKSRMGHGLVWRSYPTDRPLYSRRLPASAIRDRIDRCWRPYHDTLQTALEGLYARFGGVWHLNCHSMPASSSPYVPGRPGARADFVLGDRDGQSCSSAFTGFVRDSLTSMGYAVRVNDPYRGAELVRAFSKPQINRHSLQIEINRSLYMREATMRKTAGFETLQRDLGRLVADIGGFIRTQLTAAAAE